MVTLNRNSPADTNSGASLGAHLFTVIFLSPAKKTTTMQEEQTQKSAVRTLVRDIEIRELRGSYKKLKEAHERLLLRTSAYEGFLRTLSGQNKEETRYPQEIDALLSEDLETFGDDHGDFHEAHGISEKNRLMTAMESEIKMLRQELSESK